METAKTTIEAYVVLDTYRSYFTHRHPDAAHYDRVEITLPRGWEILARNYEGEYILRAPSGAQETLDKLSWVDDDLVGWFGDWRNANRKYKLRWKRLTDRVTIV